MEKPEKPKLGTEDKRGGKAPGPTAEDKCRAVLSVWTERRSPGEVCREMGVGWTVFKQWQERAMEGMLLALEPRILMTEKRVALNWRLAVLLERKSKAAGMKKTELRLSRLQEHLVKAPVALREDPSEKKV